jgi:hypothetical protein
LLFSIIIFNSISSLAQTDFRRGFIIEMSGDTLIGEVNYQGDIRISREIQFRNQNLDVVYRPFEILGYKFDDGRYFVSRMSVSAADTTAIFAEYLVKGEKDLFLHRTLNGFHYSLSISDSVIREIPFGYEMVQQDGKLFKKTTTHHIGFLKSYFSDCPEIFHQIEELKTLERNTLISITKEYHDRTCGEGSCIVFNKRRYPFSMAIEPMIGYYMKNKISDDAKFIRGGNVYVWIPNSGERLFVKTGFHSVKMPDGENYFQIPLQFVYQYHFHALRPKWEAGINFHSFDAKGYALTALAGGGCLVKLSNRLYFDVTLSSDLFVFDFRSPFLMTLSAQTGLVFRFY